MAENALVMAVLGFMLQLMDKVPLIASIAALGGSLYFLYVKRAAVSSTLLSVRPGPRLRLDGRAVPDEIAPIAAVPGPAPPPTSAPFLPCTADCQEADADDPGQAIDARLWSVWAIRSGSASR